MRMFFIITWITIFVYLIVAEVYESEGRMIFSESLARIEINTLSFNLQLQYSSGITVNKRASWVGLGFDISLPYIDRIPVGSVDEKADTFACNGPGFYSTKYYRKLLSDTGNGYTFNPDTGWYTSQQDFYTLNADFASGRIVFAQPQSPDVPMKAYLQNWRAFIVNYYIDSTDNISKWIIVTEDGKRYIFGQPVKAHVNENTGQTWFGTDSTWYNTSVWHTGSPGWWSTEQVKSEENYVNDYFNRRWYLTEIQSVNYDTTTCKGERIVFSYTEHNDSYHLLLSDLNKHAYENDRAATGLFSYTEDNHKHANFTFSYDNYYLYPIYPVEIISPTGKIRFVMSSSATYDKLTQGDKRIEKIETYSKRDTSFVLASQILLNYDATGLAQGHPYSSDGKGLLRLNSIERLSADGLDTLPVVAFEYGANPSFYPPTCYYKHDFYGYYRSTELHRNNGTFTYPAGQSDTGILSSPGAEAWSVTKVITGEGKTLEYQYEPGVATKVSTNEEVADLGTPLNIGIRVKKEKISGGAITADIVNTFEYGTGYIEHNFALRENLDSLYTLINRGEYRGIGNVMVLNGAGPSYEYCIKSTSGRGIVKTYFINPSSTLPIYQSNPVNNLSMADVYLSDSMYVNSLAQYRGLSWKKEYFKKGTTTNPVKSTVSDYAVKYDMYSYNTPEVVPLPLATCFVGEGSGDADMPEMADNQNQSDFIGFLRLMGSEETSDGVTIRNEVLSYNSINGLPSKTRVTNSEGKQKLTRITFAIDEKKPDQTLVYQNMKDENIINQQTETVVYEKTPIDTNTGVLSADVRSAQSITYSEALGCHGWVPWQVYSWKANFLSNGSPDKTFLDFIHLTGASNLNWQLENTYELLGQKGNILQISKPSQATEVTVLRNDNMLPIGTIKGGSFYECGIFTGDYIDGRTPNYWDYDNGWEKGTTNTVELVSGTNAHFGEKVIHVIKDYAAVRNNKVYPGKAYKMSAWVNVTNGTIKMSTDFRYANAGNDNEWPATHITTISTPGAICATPITADDCNGKWKLMTMDIPASVTSQLDTVKVWYARALVGNDPTGPSFDAYVDDVRFYPLNALVTTTYYDTRWQAPIVTVDANGKPGTRVEYDGFGRPVKWKKFDPNDHSYSNMQLTQEREYHLKDEMLSGEDIRITYLNEGGVLHVDSTYKITWKASYKINSVDILLSIDGGNTYTIPIAAVNSSDDSWGDYSWTVPQIPEGQNRELNECKIKISSTGFKSDETEEVFTINNVPYELIYTWPVPCTGGTFTHAPPVNFEFTGGDFDYNDEVQYTVHVYIMDDTTTKIEKVINENGSVDTLEVTFDEIDFPYCCVHNYIWYVTASDKYGGTIKGDKCICDFGPGEDIRITYPNEGGVLQVGQTYQIKWFASQDIGSVDILLSIDGGNTYTIPIATVNRSDDNWGDYSWIPSEGAEQCKIKISSTGFKPDETDEAFVINNAPYEPILLFPGSGDQFHLQEGQELIFEFYGGDPNIWDEVTYTVHILSDNGGRIQKQIGPIPVDEGDRPIIQIPINEFPDCISNYSWYVGVRDKYGAWTTSPKDPEDTWDEPDYPWRFGIEYE